MSKKPLTEEEEKWLRIKLYIGIIFLFIWFAWSCFYGILEWMDLIKYGPVPLREGYIPKAQRVYEDIKVVPQGEDPSKYIKSP